MTWHHVAALCIAALMVCACAGALAIVAAKMQHPEEAARMFSSVVQLATVIVAGAFGNAVTRALKSRRHLTATEDRAKLGHPPKD